MGEAPLFLGQVLRLAGCYVLIAKYQLGNFWYSKACKIESLAFSSAWGLGLCVFIRQKQLLCSGNASICVAVDVWCLCGIPGISSLFLCCFARHQRFTLDLSNFCPQDT